MKLDHYQLEANEVFMAFQFVSEGPKGRILKEIQYVEMEAPNAYNLAFGDKNTLNEDIDDKVKSNNKDAQKILATVAQSVLMFTKRHPEAWIFAEGGSPSRTRLYRMTVSNNLEAIEKVFIVIGYVNGHWVRFQRNVSYDYLIFKRK